MFREGLTESALKALGIIAQSRLGERFYLAGGTAAAIQMGHRLSEDLDYFSPDPFNGVELIKTLESDGINAFKLDPSEDTLHCIIAETKVSFFCYKHPLLEETKRFEETDLASILDIALMKIIAISARGLKKDFIDLYFILREIALQQILDKFPLKYSIEKLDPYHYLRSITYFDDAENDPMPEMLLECDWRKVRKFLEKAVSGITFG